MNGSCCEGQKQTTSTVRHLCENARKTGHVCCSSEACLFAAWIQVRNAILKIVLQNHNHGTKNHRKQSSFISQMCPPVVVMVYGTSHVRKARAGCLQLFVCHCTTQVGCPACVGEEGNKHVLFRIY
ncbi:unnamed protein product [Sphagnum jensenii]|uniref:Uncharacterized protein n=1 Tax=Sphagnum jensenii TaxID=128206 RepID=A0ABP0XB45_9BRYO